MLPTPFGSALTDYQLGNVSASFVIERSDGYQETIAAALFFDDLVFTDIEDFALRRCSGHVLDVGACAGRHSLALRRLGCTTTSLEIESACREIMESRGLQNVRIGDINEFRDGRYDTVLMLANGAGVFGTIDRLKAFLARLPTLLQPGGKLLCDSTDISQSDSPELTEYRLKNIENGELQGKVVYRIKRGELQGKKFPWLYLSYEELSKYAHESGLNCSLLYEGLAGQYLAEISPLE